MSQLLDKHVSTDLYQNITTSQAIEIVLDRVGWPVGERDIQAGLTTLTWFWVDDRDAFDVIEALRATEGSAQMNILPETPESYRISEPDTYKPDPARSTRLRIDKRTHCNPVVVSETEDELILDVLAKRPEIEGYVTAAGAVPDGED